MPWDRELVLGSSVLASPQMFDGPEPILQTSNSVYEVVAASIQRPRLILFKNVNGTSKVGDEDSDLFRCLFRRNTAISTVLNPLLHFPLPSTAPSNQAQRIRTLRSSSAAQRRVKD